MRNITLALILTACSTYKPFTPATVRAPADPFNKATRVLIQRGESVETKDEGAGIIVTAWKNETNMGSEIRLRWAVTVQSSTVTVDSQCEMKLTGDPAPGQTNAWERCGNQPGNRSEIAKSIADEIAR